MSHCPFCMTDTTDAAWVHPELTLRYCSRSCADQHVGVCEWYRLADGRVVRADEVPAEMLPAEPCANPNHNQGEHVQDDNDHTEAFAHAALRVTGTFPGHFGRLRVARIIGGFAVTNTDVDKSALDAFNVQPEPQDMDTEQLNAPQPWTLREIVQLVDALLAGGLLTQTTGARPTMVLTRAGHRALDALDAEPPHHELLVELERVYRESGDLAIGDLLRRYAPHRAARVQRDWSEA